MPTKRRKKEKEVDEEYKAALNKDFREIYGYTKESQKRSIHLVNDMVKKGIPLPPTVKGPELIPPPPKVREPGDPFKMVPPGPPTTHLPTPSPAPKPEPTPEGAKEGINPEGYGEANFQNQFSSEGAKEDINPEGYGEADFQQDFQQVFPDVQQFLFRRFRFIA